MIWVLYFELYLGNRIFLYLFIFLIISCNNEEKAFEPWMSPFTTLKMLVDVCKIVGY